MKRVHITKKIIFYLKKSFLQKKYKDDVIPKTIIFSRDTKKSDVDT